MPLVLLTMRSGYSACRSRNTVLAHELGVQRRNAVDPVRAEEGEMAHAHAAPVVFLDQRDGGQEGGVRRGHRARRARDAAH